jgi:hypothetical protein
MSCGEPKEALGPASEVAQVFESCGRKQFIFRRSQHAPRSLFNHHPLGLNCPLHQTFAQAAHAFHDEPVRCARQRIGGEHNPGVTGVHHFLHHHRHLDLLRRHPLPRQVNERPLGEKRQPARLDGSQQRVRPAHIQNGFKLTGKRHSGCVLDGRAGTHGKAPLFTQFPPRGQHRILYHLRHANLRQAGADFPAQFRDPPNLIAGTLRQQIG